MTRRWLWVTALLLGAAGVLVASAVIADLLVDDASSPSASTGAFEADPVGMWLGYDERPPAGLSGGTYVTENGVLAADGVVVEATEGGGDADADTDGEADTGTSGETATEGEVDTSSTSTTAPAATEEEAGSATTSSQQTTTSSEPIEIPDASDVIERAGVRLFRDLCADGFEPGCPIGVGATVQVFASDDEGPSELRLKLYPHLTRGIYPALRCDPGVESASRLPVVVTSNLPLESGTITLGSSSGNSKEQVKTTPDETSWYEAQKQSGDPVGFGLDGIQHCASLPIPEVAPASAGGVQTVEVEVVARSFDGREAIAREVLQLTTSGPRPATGIYPKWWNEVQVVMAHRDPALGYATSVKPIARTGPDARATTCDSVAGFVRSPFPVADAPASSGEPQAIPRAVLEHPDYTNDPSFTHRTVWNVLLQEGTRYSFCLSWTDENGQAIETEEWFVEPPNQFRIELVPTRYSQSLVDGYERLRGLLPDAPRTDWYVGYVDVGLPSCTEEGVPDTAVLCQSGAWGSGGPEIRIDYGQYDGAHNRYLPEAVVVPSPVGECLFQDQYGAGCHGLTIPGPDIEWHELTVWACQGLVEFPIEFDTRGVAIDPATGQVIENCDVTTPPPPVWARTETEWRFLDGPRTDGTGPLDWRWWIEGTEPPSL